MGWYDTWVEGRGAQGPRWWEVVLWVVLIGAMNLTVFAYVSPDGVSAAFLVVSSILLWTWVFMALRCPNDATGEPTDESGP